MALPATAYATATVTNPSSGLTDFTLLVDLSTLPASWWALVDTADATKGRAATDGGTELAVDWLSFDGATDTGWARVKWAGVLGATGTQVVRIYPPVAANASVAAGDAYGQHAAYDSDWAGYWPQGGGTDRTITAANLAAGSAGNPTVGGTTGPTGAATLYDGVDDYCVASPARPRSAYTLVSYIRQTSEIPSSTSGTDRAILTFAASPGSNTQDQGLGWQNAADKFEVYQFDGAARSAVSPVVSPTTGTFHHVVGAYDGTNQTCYANGVAGADSAAGLPANYVGVFVVGRNRSLHAAAAFSETQLHAAARPSAWVAHEYSQTADNATFWGAWTLEGGSVFKPAWAAHATQVVL